VNGEGIGRFSASAKEPKTTQPTVTSSNYWRPLLKSVSCHLGTKLTTRIHRAQGESEMPRRVVIGVFGGEQESVGKAFGVEVAKAGFILLTGGDGKTGNLKEVKNATMIGANEAALDRSVVARLIGILPEQPDKVADKWFQPTGKRQLFLKTGLGSEVRNVINGMTPDVAVVFGGGLGTVAEAIFAKAAGKELIFYDGADQEGQNSLDRLKRHLGEFEINNKMEKYLLTPLMFYLGGEIPKDWNEFVKEMRGAMDKGPTDISSLVASVRVASQKVSQATLAAKTGFPGLPGDKVSKEEFEKIVKEISS
jgi:predicted Rossmann-fold nucleotide-binding protein